MTRVAALLCFVFLSPNLFAGSPDNVTPVVYAAV